MSKRFLTPGRDSVGKPAIYHCISRVVDRRFVFGDEEREQFRMFMRMQENFSGCRVLSYCVMSNHFHILLEVPPMAEGGLSDAELLRRIGCTNSASFVATVRQELQRARTEENEAWAVQIHERFTYRMHSLSEFMKTLLQRFTRWFNRTHDRSGTLWEERYKSVIVESGIAARTVAAYIDLNPVRAGMVTDPADYRWSSYGEAVGGGRKGNGKKAREGLVRACMSHHGAGFESERWKEVSRIYRSALGLALGRKSGRAEVDKSLEDQPPFSRLRSGHRLLQRHSPGKQFPSNQQVGPEGFAEFTGAVTFKDGEDGIMGVSSIHVDVMQTLKYKAESVNSDFDFAASLAPKISLSLTEGFPNNVFNDPVAAANAGLTALAAITDDAAGFNAAARISLNAALQNISHPKNISLSLTAGFSSEVNVLQSTFADVTLKGDFSTTWKSDSTNEATINAMFTVDLDNVDTGVPAIDFFLNNGMFGLYSSTVLGSSEFTNEVRIGLRWEFP